MMSSRRFLDTAEFVDFKVGVNPKRPYKPEDSIECFLGFV